MVEQQQARNTPSLTTPPLKDDKRRQTTSGDETDNNPTFEAKAGTKEDYKGTKSQLATDSFDPTTGEAPYRRGSRYNVSA